jgi:hypothetical protein
MLLTPHFIGKTEAINEGRGEHQSLIGPVEFVVGRSSIRGVAINNQVTIRVLISCDAWLLVLRREQISHLMDVLGIVVVISVLNRRRELIVGIPSLEAGY